MKKYIIGFVIDVLIIGIYYYMFLPVINPTSMAFWVFLIIILTLVTITLSLCYYGAQDVIRISNGKKAHATAPKFIGIPLAAIFVIIAGIILVNLVCSPLFNAKSYSKRITIDETGDFSKDIEEVNFKGLPLLDKDSSQKLGDRVMGQMSDLVSQYYVSDLYTQINYNDDIIRVTPLEYAGFIKWISNRKDGVKGYITVNSVNGNAELKKLDKGMKYTPGAYFNDNLYRKLRFTYPTTIFGTENFEIDNDGNPYWIVPTYSYTGVGLKTKVSGVIIMDPITGESEKYKIEDVPTWVDIAFNASLIIEQVDDWGTYNLGFFNSIFGQKKVVKTTDGYNYLAMNDDVFMYTGITSVLSDESNLGFILSNLRTGETIFYSVTGAEEYSAMKSAEGQVQQMNYDATFPLLINLNNKATYFLSLKDAAGLVKMYAFVDVADYQKVVVSDASKGIETAAQNYLNSYAEEITDDLLTKKDIIVKKITNATINGNTFYYVTDEEGNKYKLSISLGDKLPFVSVGEKLSIGYYSVNQTEIIEITKLY